jgi:pyruvate formate lyase activating enzyme
MDTGHDALLYDRRLDGSTVCHVCAHRCLVRPGLRGICGVRENRAGRLVTLVDDALASAAVDPIEKKPFFHFLPGSRAYSIATAGCNFHCRFCQNWLISQWPRDRGWPFPGEPTTPGDIVRAAVTLGCASIAYTYTEPTVFFELALETARRAVDAGLRNVFVTNGYMTAEALDVLAPALHGANVDLKAFSESYYRKVCGATLTPVLDTIRGLRGHGIWVEVTTLVVPGHNDSDDELWAVAAWLAALDRDIPWHVSAFFPAYRMLEVPPTPVASLHRAARLGRQAGLRYVYTGNVPPDAWQDTACPSCGRWLVRRRGYRVLDQLVAGGRCPVCGVAIAGVWEDGPAEAGSWGGSRAAPAHA